MSPRSRRAFAPLLTLVVAVVALVGPAAAQDGDQGDLELLPAAEPVSPTSTSTPVVGVGDLSEAEAIAIMEDLFATDAWILSEELEDDALHLLFLETALLSELDAFAGPASPQIAQIHRAYAPWPDAPREDVVDFLLEIDEELAIVKSEIIQIVSLSPALTQALDELTTINRTRVVDGAPAPVPAGPYMQALSTLLSSGTTQILIERQQLGAEMLAELGPSLEALAGPEDIAQLAEVDSTLAARIDSLEARPAAAGGDDGLPWLLIALLGGAMLALVAGGVAVARNRSPRRAPADPVTDEILEAHRQLTGVVDETAIAEIGCGTAVAITAAHDAMIFRRESDGMRPTGSSDLFIGSILDRVINTAQPLLTAVDGDPAVGGPVSICAVPLVADGLVSAVLVARSGAEHPFDNEDRRRLELLAPALAGALLSADALDSYEHMAMVDGLTALGNRRRLDGDLEMTLNNAASLHLPVAFAMIDVDHFKHYNDAHGHEAGDVALQTVARVIAGAVRGGDVVYRYGGEEFSVLLPGATADEAAEVVERVRTAVDTAPIAGEGSQPDGRLTVSVGVATLDRGDADTLKSRADGALYQAKARGRNCVVSS